MKLPSRVKIVEVAARDGLQNESRILSVQTRLHFINLLSAAGLPVIEAGSFVSERRVPQMADTGRVLQGINKYPHCIYPVLTPNRRGMEMAIQSGAREVAIFASASERFSQHNIHCSIDESIERFAEVMALAKQQQIRVRGYLSCVLGCPYQGEVSLDAVTAVSHKLYQLGCYEISLGDTIGVGTTVQVQRMIEAVTTAVPVQQLAVHFHDTRGQALANILVALQLGVVTIDSSVGGIGGCPYASGASGNVATEKVLYMLNGMGIETAVDLARLLQARSYIRGKLGLADSNEFYTVST
jgi:hydroxymethylglutaryl-CoA lyase